MQPQQYTYGSPAGPSANVSASDLNRRLIELQREVQKLKAERAQWRAALKSTVASEIDAAMENASRSLPKPPLTFSNSNDSPRPGTATAESRVPGVSNRALQQLEERLAARLSDIGARLHAAVGTSPSAKGSDVHEFALTSMSNTVGGGRPPRGLGHMFSSPQAHDSNDELRRGSTMVRLLKSGGGGVGATSRISGNRSHGDDNPYADFEPDTIAEGSRTQSVVARTRISHQHTSPQHHDSQQQLSARRLPSMRNPNTSAAAMRSFASNLAGAGGNDAAVASDRNSDLVLSQDRAVPRAPAADLDKLRRKLATESATHNRQESVRGLSERHPLMAILDVIYLLSSTLACLLAIAFVHTEGRDKEFATGSVFFSAAVVGVVAIEVFTIGWMVSRFFLSKRKGDWEIIDDLPTIRKRYLRTWFVYDLIVALPLELIFVGWAWEAYRLLAIRHFLRVPRIISLGTSFNPLLSSRLWFRFLSVVSLLILSVGILAAIFWTLQPRYTFEESTYWAIATVTSVGYGDVVANDQSSRIFVCFAMFAGIASIAVITAFATSFLTESDHLAAEEETKKQMMYAMLEHYDVPWVVQKDVIAAMPSMLDSINKQSFAEMTAHLPTFVGQKVTDYVQAKVLAQLPLFQRIALQTPQHLLMLSRFVQQEVHPPDEVLCEEGSPASALYFLVRGNVRLLMISFDDPDDEDGDGDCEAQLVDMGFIGPGETFGELDPEDIGANRTMTAVAESVCDVLVLQQESIVALREADVGAYNALIAALAHGVLTDEPTFMSFRRD